MRRLALVLDAVVVATILTACSDDTPANESEGAGDTTASADDGTATSMGDTSATTTTGSTDSTGSTATVGDTGPASTDTGVDDGTSSTGGDDSTGTDGTDGTSGDTGTMGDECVDVGDCVIVNDCCNCMAIPADEEPPMCNIPACLQSTCDAIGVSPVVAQCEFGSCELAPMSCDPSVVSCESLPPDCPVGTLPGTDENTMCWTGGCVPAEHCDVVPSCGDCPEGEACVEYVMLLGPEFHCSPIPEACDGTPSCECLSDACIGDFDSCADTREGVSCSCIACG